VYLAQTSGGGGAPVLSLLLSPGLTTDFSQGGAYTKNIEINTGQPTKICNMEENPKTMHLREDALDAFF